MRKGAAAIVLAILTSATVTADETSFRTRLSMVPIDPATAASVTGVGEAHAALEGQTLAVTGNFNGLQGPATAAHLYAGAYTGIRGEPFAELAVTRAPMGSISGEVALTPQQVEALQAGRVYVQIDSEAAPEGNLWGWLLAN